MEIKLEDLYIIIKEGGLYDRYSSYEFVVIGKEKAEQVFNNCASGRPCDDDGYVALYKAKVVNNVIESDYENILAQKYYDEEKAEWIDGEED